MAAPTSTGRWAALAGLACALALVLLVWFQGGGESAPAPARPPVESPDPPDPAPDPPVPEAEPGVATTALVEADRRERTIVVLGPGDRPLEGVRVRGFCEPEEWVATDVRGRATLGFRPEAQDTSVRITGPVPEDRVMLESPETTVRYPDLLPLSVLVVDGETGEWVGGAGVALYRAHGGPVALDAHGARFEMPVAPVRPGDRVELAFRVDPPSGYAGPEVDWFRARGTVSRFAERVEVTIPIYRAAKLFVRVEEADGVPAAGAVVQWVKFGPRNVPFTADPVGADGRTLIGGVPALRGEPVTVAARKDGRWAESPVARLAPSGQPVEVLIRLPEEVPPRRLRKGGFTGGTSSSISIGIGGPSGTGRLEVRVLRRDGSPAAGARLRCTIAAATPPPSIREIRADDAGLAVLEKLPDATVTLEVREPGYLAPPAEKVQVREGEPVRIEIREADPSQTALTVLDEDGFPLPLARIEVEDRDGVAYARLDGTIQHLVTFTDSEGRARLPDLPAGTNVVTARYGSRSVSGQTAPGTALTLRLPR